MYDSSDDSWDSDPDYVAPICYTRNNRTGVNATMDSIPDKCLIKILSYLSIRDRLKVEGVCSRWKVLSRNVWKDFQRLDTLKTTWGKHVTGPDGTLRTSLLKLVLKRAGEYITVINLSHECVKKQFFEPSPKHTPYLCWEPSMQFCSYEAFQAIIDNCRNIREFRMCRCIIQSHERGLITLFRNNPHIRVMHIRGAVMIGECLAQLNPNLESLALDRIGIFCPSLCRQLRRFRGLHTLSLNCPDFVDNVGMEKLMHIIGSLGLNLRRLDLTGFGSHELYVGDIFANVWKLKKLKDLVLARSALQDKDIKGLVANLQELTRLNITGCYRLTDRGIGYLRHHPTLEYLNFSQMCWLTDQALYRLPKTLRRIDAIKVNFSQRAMLRMIHNLPRLEVLDLCKNDKVDNDFVNELVRRRRIRKCSDLLTVNVAQTNVRKNRRLCRTPSVRLVGAFSSHDIKTHLSNEDHECYQRYYKLGLFMPYYILDFESYDKILEMKKKLIPYLLRSKLIPEHRLKLYFTYIIEEVPVEYI